MRIINRHLQRLIKHPNLTMDAIYSAQEGIKKDLGLSKVKVIHNQNYQRHGTKSYVYLLNRFGFKPTKPGPYFHVDKVDQHGFVPEQLKGALGGTVHTSRTLVKRFEKDGEETGQVTAEDQQNDSMYICKVGIGSPPQNLLLDFDTGSADTWVYPSLSPLLNFSLIFVTGFLDPPRQVHPIWPQCVQPQEVQDFQEAVRKIMADPVRGRLDCFW